MVTIMADDKKDKGKKGKDKKGGGGDKATVFSKLLPADVTSAPLATRSLFIALNELFKWAGNGAGSTKLAIDWFRKIPSGLEHIVGKDMAKRATDWLLKTLVQADVLALPLANRTGLPVDRVREILNENADEFIEGFTTAVMVDSDDPDEEQSLGMTARGVNQFLEFGFLSRFKRDSKTPSGPTFQAALNGLTPDLRGYFVADVLTEDRYQPHLRQIYTSTAPCSTEQLRAAIGLYEKPEVRFELILACAGIRKSSELTKGAATALKEIEERIAKLAGALTDADHPDSVALRTELVHRGAGAQAGARLLRRITRR